MARFLSSLAEKCEKMPKSAPEDDKANSFVLKASAGSPKYWWNDAKEAIAVREVIVDDGFYIR